MMLFLTLLRSQLRSAFASKTVWTSLLVSALVLVFSVVYGLIFGFLLNEPDFSDEARSYLLSGIGSYGLMVLVVADYFPVFRVKNRVIPAFWPVGHWQAWRTDLLFEAIRLPAVSMVVFTVSGALAAPIAYKGIFFAVLGAVAGAMLVNDALRYQIRYACPQPVLRAGLGVALLVAAAASLFVPLTWRVPAQILMLPLGVLYSAWTYAAPAREKFSARVLADTGSIEKLALLYVWRAPVLRNTLMISLLFKLMIPLYLKVFVSKMGPGSPLLEGFFMAALLSPLSVFTYLGGNFWGAATQVWYRLRIAGAGGFTFLMFQCVALLPFLAVDLAFSLGSLVALDLFRPEAPVIWFLNTLSLFILAQWLMLWFPRRVTKTFSMRQNNVHPSFQLASMTTVILNFLAAWHMHLLLAAVIPVLMAITYAMDNPYHAQTGRRWSHQFFGALFKPE